MILARPFPTCFLSSRAGKTVAGVTLAALLALCGRADSASTVTLALAKDGQALHHIVIATSAGEQTRLAASELADYLGRITGAKFSLVTGDGTTGLAVGTHTDFPALKLGALFESGNPFRLDDYLLRTHARGAWLVGASDHAARLAVWDFLHHLGYRLYFLTDTWEVIPHKPNATVSLDCLERPHYVTRQAPRGAPHGDRKLQERWAVRNRVASSFTLSTGHAYGAIIRANKKEFDAHPEYYALVNGKRDASSPGTTKVCVSNPGLRKLFVDHAVRTMRANPTMQSISMDPSDGGNWCECEACRAFGSVTDRALTLANEVADAINRLGLGRKFVGIYAYNQHSPPPTIRVHPNVVVSVATSFLRGGFTVEQLIEGWRAKGATLGIREYHDVFTWSHDLPRKARGGDLAYLAKTIPYFYRQGARFMNSENSDSWGANGLGYWITPRLLWNTALAEKLDTLVEDFLHHAFPKAETPMREFYRLLNLDKSTRPASDVVARMYRSLQAAYRLADDPKVRARLDDLVLYTRYVELHLQYERLSGTARQQKFEEICRHARRMRDRWMLSAEAVCRGFRDPTLKPPKEKATSTPFAAQEIQAILLAGVEANPPMVLKFQPVEFSKNLVPATPLALPSVPPGKCSDQTRGHAKVFTWLAAPNQAIELRVTGGLIPHYRDRGNVSFHLYAEQEATLEAVAHDASVPPDGKPRQVVLRSPYAGLHWLEWTDGGDRTEVVPPVSLPWTIRTTLEDKMPLQGRWSLYFYVPHGTKVIGGFADGNGGWIVNPQGQRVFRFDGPPGGEYFHAPVPAGQDGALWKMEDVTGARVLMTVPSCFAKTAETLLLPKEVIEADAKTGK